MGQTLHENIADKHKAYYRDYINSADKALKREKATLQRINNSIEGISQTLAKNNRTAINSIIFLVSQNAYINGFVSALKYTLRNDTDKK